MTLDEMKRRLRDDSEAWRAWTEDPANAAEVATLNDAIRKEIDVLIAKHLASTTWASKRATTLEQLIALATRGRTHDDFFATLVAVTEATAGRKAADALMGF